MTTSRERPTFVRLLRPDGDPPATPQLSFDHLVRLSDDTGLFEHARGAIPRREHGYCLDDVARALVVLSRVPPLEVGLHDLATSYLAFVAHAQDAAGRCHNRLGYDRKWQDEASTEDCWGRALWGLGSLATGKGPPWLRAEALDHFELSAGCRSAWPRAMAFAGLGASAVLQAHPGHTRARHLLRDVLPLLGHPGGDPGWPWPEPRLSYANAAVAEALMATGSALDQPRAVTEGLSLLHWLFDVQTADGHLSPVPAHGWSRGEPRPAFDQQPIEVAALADGAARALSLTGDPSWAARLQRCIAWFAGDNDSGAPLYSPITGGGFDGLERDGYNANQGAESTLAALSTLQHARLLSVTGC